MSNDYYVYGVLDASNDLEKLKNIVDNCISLGMDIPNDVVERLKDFNLTIENFTRSSGEIL
jgi:hypothetical protein